MNLNGKSKKRHSLYITTTDKAKVNVARLLQVRGLRTLVKLMFSRFYVWSMLCLGGMLPVLIISKERRLKPPHYSWAKSPPPIYSDRAVSYKFLDKTASH